MTDAAPLRSPWRIYGLIAGAIALATLNFSLVFVAFGEIEESFDASKETVSWALTAFSITTAAIFVPAGWAADRFGRRRMFLTGFGTFIVGSALGSVIEATAAEGGDVVAAARAFVEELDPR